MKRIVEEKKNYKQTRDTKYLCDSKDRLSKILKKKIQTTMIGSLSTIEEHLGFLWDGDSKEHAEMRKIYEKIRSEILDKGNNQSRNIDAELSQYEVKWLKYQLQLPVVKKPN